MANGNIMYGLTGQAQPLMPSVDPMALQPMGGPLAQPGAAPAPQQPAMPAAQQPAMPAAQPPAGAMGQFGGPGGMERLNQLYGIMARSADDPAAIGQSYVSAVQAQQQFDRANTPMQQHLSIYGKVNPHDWTPESMQAFDDHYVATGQVRYDLLRERNKLSSEDEKQIYKAFEAADAAGNMAMQANELAGRFERMSLTGNVPTGFAGWVDQWLTENITGNFTDINDMRLQFKGLRMRNGLSLLPPGVASDRDVRLAFGTFPTGNEDPAYVASYLRGIQKLQIYEYAKNQFKAENIGLNKGPTRIAKEWKDSADEYVLDAMNSMGVELYNNDYFGDRNIWGREAAKELARTRGYGQTYGGGMSVRAAQPGAAAGAPAGAPIGGGPAPAQQEQQPLSREQEGALLRKAIEQRGYR